MAWYRDDYGRLWEYDDPKEAARDRLVPATADDIARHNESARWENASGLDKASELTTTVLRTAAGVSMLPGMAIQEAITGEPVTSERATPEVQARYSSPGADLEVGVLSEEARAQRARNPTAAGIGTALAATPLAGAAGLIGAGAGAAAAGAAGLGAEGLGTLAAGAAGGALGAAVPQAVLQEYDDAWLEQRPYELARVAGNTMMFAATDLVFGTAIGGAWKLGKRVFGGAPEPTLSIGPRDVVSEAQRAARQRAPEASPAGGGGSVGAASADDLAEPFDHAIGSMSDKDAAVLARDAVDHEHLISQNASESFTRINQGLTDSLGSRLKYEQFAQNAQGWDDALLERQTAWLEQMANHGDEVARELGAAHVQPEGPRTPQGARAQAMAIDYGNFGKKAIRLIDDFNLRLQKETDPARRNWLTDNLKKQLDALTLDIDGSYTVDPVLRDEFKKLVTPLREGLRKGLENPGLFGENAELQRSLNGPWHRFLQHWPAVQREVLEATGAKVFDQAGAGRIVKESTVDRMRALFGRDPRSNQEFGAHLRGAFEGLQDLIEAQQARGIVTEGLDVMARDVGNLMEDWNLASTVGVAKNRVAAMKRDPRKWASIALDMGERLPLVGKPIQIARNLGDALTDLHLEKGSALDAVWDRAYRRYAQNPALEDPSISRNYADWVIDALRQRGGPVGAPPAGTAGPLAGAAAPEAPPGFRQAARPSDVAAQGSLFAAPEQPRVQLPKGLRERVGARGVETPDEARALLGGQAPLEDSPVRSVVGDGGPDARGSQRVATEGGAESPLSGDPALSIGSARVDAPGSADGDVFSAHAGTVAHGGIFHERLSGKKGANAGGLFRGTDGKIRYIKAHPDPAHVRTEAGNTRMYAALGRQVPAQQVVDLGEGKLALASEVFPHPWRPLSEVQDWSTLPKSVRDSYAEGVVTDFLLGNWDVSHNAGNVLTDGVSTAIIDAGEATANPARGAYFEGAGAAARAELRLTQSYGEGESLSGLAQPPPHALLQPYAHNKGELQQILTRSYERAVKAIDEHGGVEDFVRKYQPEMSAPEVTKTVKEITERIAQFGKALPFFATALYLAFSSREAGAAEPPPPPSAAPAHAYRDALREISKGGDREISLLSAEALRRRPTKGRGKGPLELFAAKGNFEDGVHAARERLAEIASDPTALVRTIAASTGELGRTHPSVYAALVQKSAQLSSYLQSVAPQPTATTLLDPRGGKLSFDRAWDFAARFIGAAQPRAAMKEVVRGTAPPEMIEALKANWRDELWEPFRAETLGRVQRMHAAGRHIPSEKLLRLDRVLELDGQLDPSASRAVAMHMLTAQDAEAAERQQAGQSGGGGAMSRGSAVSMRTRLGAIASERVGA